MKVLVVSGGTIYEEWAADMLRHLSFDRLIAMEKGALFCLAQGVRPDLVVGDFDTAGEEGYEAVIREGIPVERHPSAKDATDTELAVELAVNAGATQVILLCATGSRLDHVLGNIAMLSRLRGLGIDAEILDPHNRIRLVLPGTFSFTEEEMHGKYLSLIPYGGPVCGVTLRGFRFPGENLELPVDSSLGISNELTEKEGTVSFKKGQLLMIVSND